jgi:hypothetical protein
MHPIHTAAMVASLAALSACAGYQMETTEPTVSYAYSDSDDYEIIEEKADLYCAEEYRKDAVLVDRDIEDEGYEATFACR